MTLFKRSGHHGFTLIEMMLSVAIIAILAGLSAPIYQSLQVRNDLDIAVATIAQSARRSQLLSQAAAFDSSWGLSIQSGTITIYRGSSFSLRDPEYDESFSVPASITASGITSTVFAKFSGLPQTTGTITLTSNINEARTITINNRGMVSY